MSAASDSMEELKCQDNIDCSHYPEDCNRTLTGCPTQDSGSDPTGEPDQNSTSRPAGETLTAQTAQIQLMKRLFCVAGSRAERLDVDLTSCEYVGTESLRNHLPVHKHGAHGFDTWVVGVSMWACPGGRVQVGVAVTKSPVISIIRFTITGFGSVFHPVPSSFKELLATFCPSIYYISSAMKTWNESRKDCLERGADLVIINSREEQNFLREFRERLWIGLTAGSGSGRDREWKWVDGTRLNTSYWVPGEPNNYENRGEYCVEIRNFQREDSWNDLHCGDENYWICERNLQ
ncbi:hypothetical protein CCH79_00020106 [Gambusia affinis]|uniref:C-type lectin domain-containing protein n=1 Tax=Gambusia affinis TaxID=33528 RepID=A0A315UXS1_GAMAF|nr:hypothetical protein CCH79_00020106 [Gambusia affinis]